MSKKISNKKLPTKPSKLIRLALKDLKEVERMPLYTVDMNHYHYPIRSLFNVVCHVCFAGAVIARTLNSSIDEDIGPYDFDRQTGNALDALDDFRVGWLSEGMKTLTGDKKYNQEKYRTLAVDITPYENDPTTFKRDMALLADAFEKYGH